MSLIWTSAGSVVGSRTELAGQRQRVLRLAAVTVLGGGAGACALLLAPAGTFALVIPVLIAAASVLLLIQPMFGGLSPRPGAERSVPRMAGLFGGAMYIGYFGAAGGMILLTILAAMFADSLIRLNALKNVITGMANAVAAVAFAAFAPVDWAVVPLLAAGFLLGGMAGPRIARRLPARKLRLLISVCGLALAVKLGLSAYR
jgi:hypothetical protein